MIVLTVLQLAVTFITYFYFQPNKGEKTSTAVSIAGYLFNIFTWGIIVIGWWMWRSLWLGQHHTRWWMTKAQYPRKAVQVEDVIYEMELEEAMYGEEIRVYEFEDDGIVKI